LDFQYTYNDTTSLPSSSNIGIDSLNDPNTKLQVLKSVNLIVSNLIQLAKINPPTQPWQQQRLVYLNNIQKRWQAMLQKNLSDVSIPKLYHAGSVAQFQSNLKDGMVHPTNDTYGFYGAWFSTHPEQSYGTVTVAVSSAAERLNASRHSRQWQVYPSARYWLGVLGEVPFLDLKQHKLSSLAGILVTNQNVKQQVVNTINSQFSNDKTLRDAVLSLVIDYDEGLLQRQIILLARIYSADRANALLEWGYGTESFSSNSSAVLCLANFTTDDQLDYLRSTLFHGEVLWSQDYSFLAITKLNTSVNVTQFYPSPSPYASRSVISTPLSLTFLASLSQSFYPVRRLGLVLNDPSHPQTFMQQLANGQVKSIVEKIDKNSVVGCGRCCLFIDNRNPSSVLAAGNRDFCMHPNVLCPSKFSTQWDFLASIDVQHCSLCNNF